MKVCTVTFSWNTAGLQSHHDIQHGKNDNEAKCSFLNHFLQNNQECPESAIVSNPRPIIGSLKNPTISIAGRPYAQQWEWKGFQSCSTHLASYLVQQSWLKTDMKVSYNTLQTKMEKIKNSILTRTSFLNLWRQIYQKVMLAFCNHMKGTSLL